MKSFTAVCIMTLVRQGRISLDNTLADFFPEYDCCADYEEVSQITIGDLLHMRSGIPDFRNAPSDFFGYDRTLELINDAVANGRTMEERERDFFESVEGQILLECVFGNELYFEPGTMFSYSNTNDYLLACIIEKVTWKPYEEYMNETVFEPCGFIVYENVVTHNGSTNAFLTDHYIMTNGDDHLYVIMFTLIESYNRAGAIADILNPVFSGDGMAR